MNKLEILRSITRINPAITAQIIDWWGTPAFFDYIDNLLDKVDGADATQMLQLLDHIDALKALHRDECPRIPCPLPPADAEVRALPDFATIADRFPHVGRRLIQSWGSEIFYAYVGGLFTDTRGGKRQGFPREVVRAISHVAAAHEKIHPRRAPRVFDVWQEIAPSPRRS